VVEDAVEALDADVEEALALPYSRTLPWL